MEQIWPSIIILVIHKEIFLVDYHFYDSMQTEFKYQCYLSITVTPAWLFVIVGNVPAGEFILTFPLQIIFNRNRKSL